MCLISKWAFPEKAKEDTLKAIKENSMTEFEKAVLDIIPDHNTHTDSVEAFAKRNADRLLAIARKQIASEIDVDAMVDACKSNLPFTGQYEEYGNALAYQYKSGIEDTLKKIKGE